MFSAISPVQKEIERAGKRVREREREREREGGREERHTSFLLTHHVFFRDCHFLPFYRCISNSAYLLLGDKAYKMLELQHPAAQTRV